MAEIPGRGVWDIHPGRDWDHGDCRNQYRVRRRLRTRFGHGRRAFGIRLGASGRALRFRGGIRRALQSGGDARHVRRSSFVNLGLDRLLDRPGRRRLACFADGALDDQLRCGGGHRYRLREPRLRHRLDLGSGLDGDLCDGHSPGDPQCGNEQSGFRGDSVSTGGRPLRGYPLQRSFGQPGSEHRSGPR